MPTLIATSALAAALLVAQHTWVPGMDQRVGPTCMAISRFVLDSMEFNNVLMVDLRPELWRRAAGFRRLTVDGAVRDARHARAVVSSPVIREPIPASLDLGTLRPYMQSLVAVEDRGALAAAAMVKRLGSRSPAAADYAVLDRINSEMKALGPFPEALLQCESVDPAKEHHHG